jgi:hypothetical protein
MALAQSRLPSEPPPSDAAPADSGHAAPEPLSLARAIARGRAWLAEGGDSRLAQLVAGKVFLVRIVSALLALFSQVLLARWMGSWQLRVRHLHLCLDLGADDRRDVGHRAFLGGAALHSGIHRT